MKRVDKLKVTYHDRTVGQLRMTPDSRNCVFQYDPQWLAEGFSISPIELPLKPDMFIAKPEPFYGNFGIFEDSLPDGYGRYLLNRILKKQGVSDFDLSSMQRLSIVGSSGMGALCYVPESYVGEEKALPQMDELQKLALMILSEKWDKDEEVLYFNSGNSGGCRPKCLMKDDEGSWLVKFRHTYDPQNMGAMEAEYNSVAQRCGIVVPDFKLVEGKYFASKRFDLDDNGERLHTATAGALLCESILMPKMDYRTLLHLTGYLTQSVEQVEQMYRRMIFNILTANKDDHAKNFSFIYRGGAWHLSPAYDLTLCTDGYHGERATSVNNSGNPSLEDVLTVGKSIKITKARCTEIIDEVAEGCKSILQPNKITTRK
ncbi:MAG: type II toxin-antitoxin system HipA family toxin [Rikenellaceae bacterium]